MAVFFDLLGKPTTIHAGMGAKRARNCQSVAFRWIIDGPHIPERPRSILAKRSRIKRGQITFDSVVHGKFYNPRRWTALACLWRSHSEFLRPSGGVLSGLANRSRPRLSSFALCVGRLTRGD